MNGTAGPSGIDATKQLSETFSTYGHPMPECSSYQSDVNLFIDGETIMSQENTTQGEPLAIATYAIGTIPLIFYIPQLSNESIKQVK